jgi:hypothetical protein
MSYHLRKSRRPQVSNASGLASNAITVQPQRTSWNRPCDGNHRKLRSTKRSKCKATAYRQRKIKVDRNIRTSLYDANGSGRFSAAVEALEASPDALKTWGRLLFRKCYEMLRNIRECYEKSKNVMKCYEIFEVMLPALQNWSFFRGAGFHNILGELERNPPETGS